MKKRGLLILFILVGWVAFADVYDVGVYGTGPLGLDGIRSYNDEIGGTGGSQVNTTLLADNEVETVYSINEEYYQGGGACIYCPKAAGNYPAVLLTHGWNGNKNQLNFIAKHLATHGYVAITFYCKDLKRPFEWTHSFTATYNLLVAENSRPGSILYGKVNLQKVGIAGHSMGGAGALHTAMSFLNGKVATVIGLNPYNGGNPVLVDNVGGGNEELKDDLSDMAVPTLIIAGSQDNVAYPHKCYIFYETLPSTLPKAFASLKGSGHLDYDGTGSGSDGAGGAAATSAILARKKKILTLVTAWFNLYLKDEGQYAGYFQENGAEHLQMVANNDFKMKTFRPEPDYASANISGSKGLWGKIKSFFN